MDLESLPHSPFSPGPVGQPFTRAAIDVDAVSTTYIRAGTGAPVVLLAGPGGLGADDALLPALASRFCVVAPELARPGAWPAAGESSAPAFSEWLRGFLDGLGLLQASIVADEHWALRALSFCQTDPLRVERLVLCYRDAADRGVRAAAAPDVLGRSGHPLLVRCQRLEPLAAPESPVDDVVTFLLGQDPAAGSPPTAR